MAVPGPARHDGPMRAAHPSEQCAWMLRIVRAGAPDPRHRTVAGLASAFGVHRAQVLRWERGDVRLTARHAAAYEEVCGLPAGSVTSAFENVHRDHRPWGAHAVLLDREAETRTGYAVGDLVERLLAPEPTTGLQWWELAGSLTPDTADVLRRRDWEQLFDRLLTENEYAFGVPYTLRKATLARLVAHRRPGEVFTGLAREALRGSDRHVYSDLANGLFFTPTPEAARVLVDLVLRPASEPALWSALFALVGRVRAGAGDRLPEELTEATVRHLLDPAQTYRVRRSAAALLRHLDPVAAQRLAAPVVLAPGHRGVAEVLRFGHVLGPKDARAYAGRLSAAVLRHGCPVDDILHEVLTRAVTEADVILRDGARLLLTAAEILRVPVASVTVDLLAENAADAGALAHECLAILFWVSGPETLERILRVGLDARVPVEVRARALMAAAPGLTPGDEVAQRVALGAVEELYARGGDPRLTDAAVYLLGTRGLTGPLAAVRERAERDGAAAWVAACDSWLGLPRWYFPADGAAARPQGAARDLPSLAGGPGPAR